MSDFRKVRKVAHDEGILLDGCGSSERHYTWGLYTDFCGMTIEDVKKGTYGCVCDHSGNTPSGNTSGSTSGDTSGNTSGTTALTDNVLYVTVEKGEVIITPTEKTDVDITVALEIDDENYNVSVNTDNVTQIGNRIYSIKMSHPVSGPYLTGIIIKETTDGTKSGYTMDNIEIKPNKVTSSDGSEYNYSVEISPTNAEYDIYYGYTLEKNTVSVLTQNIITGSTSNKITLTVDNAKDIDITIPDYGSECGLDLNTEEGYVKFMEEYNMDVFITIPKAKYDTKNYDVIDKLFSISYVDSFALVENGDITINNMDYTILLIKGENNAFLPDGDVTISTITLTLK